LARLDAERPGGKSGKNMYWSCIRKGKCDRKLDVKCLRKFGEKRGWGGGPLGFEGGVVGDGKKWDRTNIGTGGHGATWC